MGGQKFSRKLLWFLLLFKLFTSIGGAEVCSNTILPGSKGDPGEKGDDGDQGKPGKTGPAGLRGLTGELGSRGESGPMGKRGPIGERGDKGDRGTDGPSGLKGKPGTTCDCGRYRKVVGQLDISISKLKDSVKFVKHGIKETEDKFYLIVKEARKYRDALMNCKVRGGTLAVPNSQEVNALIAGYVNQAGLTGAFIGQTGQSAHVVNSTPQTFTAWGPDEPRALPTNDTCVEMVSTGVWNQVECHVAMYYVCEFRRGKTAPVTGL